MAKRKRKQFGSSPVVHRQQAAKAAEDIGYAAAILTNKARNGQCAAATMAYAEMQQAIGRYEAHVASGGQTIYKPTTAIRDAAYDYNQNCVRASTTVSGRRRRR